MEEQRQTRIDKAKKNVNNILQELEDERESKLEKPRKIQAKNMSPETEDEKVQKQNCEETVTEQKWKVKGKLHDYQSSDFIKNLFLL
jgi:N-acetylneuraminic acid mutarotase